MKVSAFILLAASAAVAYAKCPNNCNAHGRCTVDDLCLCFPGFTGYDCSERACPAAEAWAVNDEVDPHTFVECANRGICDRSSGICQCFDGFTGAACERNACPNDCSGNGRCRMIQDFPNYEQDATLSWDEKAIQACLCDGGWTGADCSQRLCPVGDDPVTQCDRDDNVEQVQQIRAVVYKKLDAASTDTPAGLSDLVAIVGDQISLSFLTPTNSNYSTQMINGFWGDGASGSNQSVVAIADIATFTQDTDAESRFEAALESLPNFAIRDVTVSHSSSGVANEYIENKFLVTFHHLNEFQNNYGAQNLLHCAADLPCPGPGCQPRVRQSYLTATMINDGNAGNYSFVDAQYLDEEASSTDAPWVRIHTDSVVGCPVGQSCSTTNKKRLMATVIVAYKSSTTTAVDGEIWVYGMGANHADNRDLTAGRLTGGEWGWEVNATSDDWLVDQGFTYAGFVDSTTTKIDISKVVPNTWLQLGDTTNKVLPELSLGAAISFEPARCEVVDVTEDATAGAEVGLSNSDVESIECSGRGECMRDSGICECFEGHTGLACEQSSTVL